MGNMIKNRWVIGSRGSRLALRQAEMVKSHLLSYYPDIKIDISIIKTTGDKILDSPLFKMGDKGVFVKEIEEGLLERRIDLAVHSMKDVPTELPDGLKISAVLKREEYRDAFVSNRYQTFSDLPAGAVVGTSSLRRSLQVLRHHPRVSVTDIRGNMETRLQKLDQREYDAIIMSAAGLERLGLQQRIREKLNFLPAIGQGAIAVEIRKSDSQTERLISCLNDPKSFFETHWERFFLKKMGGGCQVPIGAIAIIHGKKILMKALIGSLDGNRILEHNVKGFLKEAENLISSLSEKLLEDGGKAILESISYV